MGIKDGRGADATPAFTDYEALFNWDPNTPSVGLRATDYFGMLLPLPFQEVVINPHDPRRKMIRPGGRVTRREFECLAKGIVPNLNPAMTTIKTPSGTKLSFQKTDDNFPHSTMERIKEVLARAEEVQSAFSLMIRIGEEAPHRAIAICFSAAAAEGRQRTLAKYVLEIVRPLLAKNEKFDVLPVKANSNLWEDMVRTVSPFYDRVI